MHDDSTMIITITYVYVYICISIYIYIYLYIYPGSPRGGKVSTYMRA